MATNEAERIKERIPVLMDETPKAPAKSKKGALTVDPKCVQYGEFSNQEVAQVYHWLYDHLPGKDEHTFIGTLLTTHALTALERHRTSCSTGVETSMADAYRSLVVKSRKSRKQDGVDVDWECQKLLEEKMLRSTKESGPAGYQVWGLDLGPHQDGWDPYDDMPDDWRDEKRLQSALAIKVSSSEWIWGGTGEGSRS